MELLELKTFKHSTDGQMISVTYETDAGPVEIRASTGALRGIIQQLAAIIWDADKAAETKTGKQFRTIPAPSQAQAQPTKNLEGVVLRFLMPNKLEFLFALAKPLAIRFRTQLDKAISGQSPRWTFRDCLLRAPSC